MKGILKFRKKGHMYTKDGVKYESVSTFIKKFFRPFDAKEIAKKMHWVNLRKGIKISAAQIKKDWKAKADYGTKIHKELEEYINKERQFYELSTPATLGAEIHHKLFASMDEPHDFVEFMVHDDDLKIAGTIDLVFFEDEEFTIVDWKTNSTIKHKGWEKSPHPLMKDEEDCNYTHYVLQLSMYAYILERRGFVCKKLYIAHLNGIESDLIEVPYRVDKIKEMIEWRD